jgi:PST family polysaccharide transporter
MSVGAPSAPSEPRGGLAGTAARGTGLTTIQALVNKLATVVSMWVVALELGPDEIAMASVTLALGIYLVILPPLTLGDVLVAHQRRFDIVAPAAQRIALVIGFATAAFIAIAAPFLANWYSRYPTGTMMALVWVLALRPVADALCPVALASLRRDFRYGTIALTDGSIQLLATLATVAMAIAGASAFSLVVPQVVATFLKAIVYWKASAPRTGRPHPIPAWVDRAVTRSIVRETLLAGSAQYAHNIVVVLPIVILGYCSTADETGLYSFAFMLSAQANGLIASQLGTFLQPIFGRLGHDPLRQAQAFLRVLRTIGAVAVPMTLIQAALARPLFELVLEPKWAMAIPVFAVLSVLEGFYFATAPTMSLLRAQRRFGAYFGWQVTHLAVAAVAFALVAVDHGAMGVAVASLACWGLSLPTAVWLCGRPTRRGVAESIGVFTAPWSAALPVALGTWWLGSVLVGWGDWGRTLSLGLLGPAAFLACILLTRWTQPAAWADLQPMIGGVLRRLRPARAA